ncbi:MAG TPA: hypothetical protein VHX13_00440 [Acidobacteriaceae bacterium]|jgi:hypothetical protein|nr:hypothetical protein [Acidobacteriaceae bacterium]
MKTLVRFLVWIALVVWLGGLLYFPVVAASSFGTIADTHVAGTIVAKCLVTLHHEGLFAGCWIVLFLLLGIALRVYGRSMIIGVIVTLVMFGFTAYSQFSIIPRMEHDRIAAGGAIDAVPHTNPLHADFDRLHVRSEHVEEVVMLAGLLLVILLARDIGPDVLQRRP